MSPCGRAVASPPWRRGPQVRAPWHRGGHGVVDVMGPVAPPGRASGRGDAGVYTDRQKWSLGAVLGHSCTLLRRCGQAWVRRSVHRSAKTASRSRFGPFVYTVATRGLRLVARAPQPPWSAGSAPRWPASPLAGKTGSARVTPPPGWRFHWGVNPRKPPKSRQICRFRDRLGPRSHHSRAHGLWHGQLHRMGEGMLRVASRIHDPALSR